MRDTVPSATAFRAALRRAAHQLWDQPRVFDDPLSLRIIGPDSEQKLGRSRPGSESTLARTIRAIMVVRSRFCEESLATAVAGGTSQYVILGAGLDTFAFRNPHQGLQVFEVDHPASQSWKRERLSAAGIVIPATVAFVAFDLTLSELAARLKQAGWNDRHPSFFSCLGVSSYLPRSAFLNTLRFVAALPRGSTIVFDVSTPSSQVSLLERFQRALVQVKAVIEREPLLSRFDPKILANELRAMGFGEVEDLAAADINARYLGDRADGLRVSARSALLRATV